MSTHVHETREYIGPGQIVRLPVVYTYLELFVSDSEVYNAREVLQQLDSEKVLRLTHSRKLPLTLIKKIDEALPYLDKNSFDLRAAGRIGIEFNTSPHQAKDGLSMALFIITDEIKPLLGQRFVYTYRLA